MDTPMLCSARIFREHDSKSPIRTLSVISRPRHSPSRPLDFRVDATTSTKSGMANWRPDTFTLTLGLGKPASCQSRICWQTPLKTHVPIEMIIRSEEHTSELQSQSNLVCRL